MTTPTIQHDSKYKNRALAILSADGKSLYPIPAQGNIQPLLDSGAKLVLSEEEFSELRQKIEADDNLRAKVTPAPTFDPEEQLPPPPALDPDEPTIQQTALEKLGSLE